MEDTRLAVAHTGLLVAAMRAEESARRDRLFTDPFAERLAGNEGRELLAQAVAKTGAASPQIAIRRASGMSACCGLNRTAFRRW